MVNLLCYKGRCGAMELIDRISKPHIQIYIYIYTYILYFTMRHILSNFKHLVQQFARYIYTFHELQISLVIPTTEVHWK